MKIRCLIVDDKPLAIDILADYVNKVPFLELAATTTNPVEGLSLLNEQKIDLVFLDIQMPELTGLQFIRIAGKQCKVILTTAYAEYALDGYEHAVLDYLLKPIPFDRFYRAIEKIRNQFSTTQSESSKRVQEDPRIIEYLFVKTEHRIQKINLRDIVFIEGLQNYIDINTLNGRVLSLQTLKKIEEQLPQRDFMRVHKSFIISLRHITSIERGRIAVIDRLIPLGENYRDAFYALIHGK